MITIQRMPICRKLNEQQRKWLNTNCCPNCGLPKDKWKRRIDWTCCSIKCSEDYQKCFYIWQYWKVKAFERDKYTCVKCGIKPKHRVMKSRKTNHGTFEYYWKETNENNSSELIADHIIPIAIGGEEYDLNNVQTLCLKCNKIKTKKDLKDIALYRKKHKSQRELTQKIGDGK